MESISGTTFLVLALAAPVQEAAPSDASAPGLLLREREVGVMGTSLEVRVLGADADALEHALDAAIAEIRRVEDVMTDWRPSELMRLNDAAGSGPFEVSAELAKLIDRSLRISELTGGAFDVTYAGVGRLWDFKKRPPVIPDREQIARAQERVGFGRVRVDLRENTVELPAGMRIGLGGIAKGYGVDRAMTVLLDLGIEHAIVNAGGDLKALGTKFGEPWEIAIRHPRDRERVIALLPVSNTCVVTSGDYERFFEHEGERYHHIIDPRTGYPSTGCTSATVVAPDAAFADGLATALCVLAPEEGLALVEGLDRVECMLIGMDGAIHVSEGLRGSVDR